jgi:hypothetical protein
MNVYVSWTERDVFLVFRWFAICVSGLYCLVFVSYLWTAVLRTDFKYGYYRPELKPGPFVNDRYSHPRLVLLLNDLRLFAFPCALWVTQGRHMLGFKISLYRAVLRVLLALDVVLIVWTAILGCFFCNNGVFRNGICDGDLDAYCSVFWEEQTHLCAPRNYTYTAEQAGLEKRPSHSALMKHLVAFFALDVLAGLHLALVNAYRLSTYPRGTFPAEGPYDREEGDDGEGRDGSDRDLDRDDRGDRENREDREEGNGDDGEAISGVPPEGEGSEIDAP